VEDGRPSRTAWRVAVRRAAHQLLDSPPVLDDPIALRIIGPEAVDAIRQASWKPQLPYARGSRAFLAARSRFAEDALADATQRGVRQYVVLGAGLDTFAYRNPLADGSLRVFEVDHPATQAWKRRALADNAIAIPASVTYAPVDFERETVEAALAAAGFDRQAPAFFSWLGVTWYLTVDAIVSTLAFVASTPPHGGIAFDYGIARESQSLLGKLAYDAIGARVARAGEPFRTLFDPAALRAQLEGMRFHDVVDIGKRELNERYFAGRNDDLRVPSNLGRVISARTPA
jgi:methyltransferase (TIGR00027 family)